MIFSTAGRSPRIRVAHVALTCALFVAAFTLNLEASDQWAEQFTLSFSAQIIGVLDGIPTPPESDRAALRVVAGLNPGDPILIDASDGTQHAATVVDVDAVTHWVTWTPAIPSGVIAKQNGVVQSPYALLYPQQSAIDAQGRIYTVDTANDRIVVFKDNGQILWTLGERGRIYSNDAIGVPPDEGPGPCNPACPDDPAAMLGQFLMPYGIDVSPDGTTLVVGDSANHRVQVFHENPIGPIVAAAGAMAGPRFDAYVLGGFGTSVGKLNFAEGGGVSLSRTGRIAVADKGNQRIQVFTPNTAGSIVASDGAHRFSALTFGHFGTALAEFSDPGDVEFDRSGTPTDGRMVVADTGNHRVQIFDALGSLVYAIQTDVVPSDGPGDFDAPLGVTVDDSGRIYVADYANNRIQIFTPSADASTYALNDPDSDVFGAEQTPDPVPGEIPFLGPTGVAVGSGRLIVTELDGSRVKVLTRADLGIDTVTVSRTSLTVQDPDNDTVHVTVRVRNTGGVDLTNVTLSATTTYLGTLSSVVPAHVDLTHGDSATFEFDFTVTGLDGGSTLHFDLSASGSAGTVLLQTSQNVDTHVVVNQPTGPAIALGNIVVTPTRAGVNQHITVTVPIQNNGGQTLLHIVTTVTPMSANLPFPVTPDQQTNSVLIASLPAQAKLDVTFSFTATALGVVRFNISVTAEDGAGDPVPDEPLTATVPVPPGVEIVGDNIAPTVSVTVTPGPNPRSLDGKDWYNLAWPAIHVTAVDNAQGSGVERIGWQMVDTSNQPQSDQSGSCSPTSGSIWPSACAIGPDDSLLWDRTLTGMQKRIVLAFWAEDQAGNGAASSSDELACLAQAVTPGITRINLVTCLTLFVDVDPPLLVQGAITLNSDNTEARIAFTAGDPISQVSGMTSPDALLVNHGGGSGELVLQSEGASVTAHVIVTDYARNAATFVLPFQGPRAPALRLDHTPPDAFNRIDPTALGRRCTTTISGQPVSYACTNKVYGTDNLPGLTTAAFAPISVLPARWGGNVGDDRRGDRDDGDDDDWDALSAELQTYTFTDAFVPPSDPAPTQSPNQVTLIEKVRQAGSEARVRVMSYQYQQGTVAGPVIRPDRAYKKYEWARNSDGSLKSLAQKFEIGKGRSRVQVVANFDTRKNVTRIVTEGPHSGPDGAHDNDRDDDRSVPGLILLRMTTRQGTLEILYDINSPVPVPDLAPPVVTLPSSQTVEATSPSGAAVTFDATAIDTVDGVRPVVCTAVSGSTFPLGTTTVGCSAADAAGNVAQRTMTVIVRDTTRPVLTLPATITVTASSSAGVPVSYAASATDVVSGTRPVQCSPGSGSTFKVGTSTVSCSASDTAGNTATASFTVIVRKN